VQELTGFVAPFFHFIITLFGASTAGSIPFILSSCLFLTGFSFKTSRRSLKVGDRKVSNKEGSTTYGTEQGDQANSGKPKQSPETVSREYQRAHESLEQTIKRLRRKYGEDQFNLTAQRVDEDAKGVDYPSMAKNVPVKYISIGQAAEEFGIANSTLATWVTAGLLYNVTKVEHPANPESGMVLVEPREVAKLKEKLGAGPEAAEPKLIALPDAARKYDLPYETVRTWYQRGHLLEKGREVFGTHGGGKILVEEQEVIHLVNRRTPKRNPPSKPAE
jgi:transposase-like protein